MVEKARAVPAVERGDLWVLDPELLRANPMRVVELTEVVASVLRGTPDLTRARRPG